MKNQTEERKLQYVRLLSYDNACNLIEFVKKNDKEDYAHITPGGVSLQVADKNWNTVIDYIESLGVRYEINTEHPSITTQKIIQNLADRGVIENKFTDHQSHEIISRRHKIVVAYCKQKGWDPNPETLKMEQIMEIRQTPEWKEVPQKVKEESKTNKYGHSNNDEAKTHSLDN